ncbi:hypothetical protein CWI38_0042p0070 [Hamiltosporidium tvaerminnensis]|uniref:Uncharacterized protein n=1 Tax=Hamiltosporidium tvaerminnensis TaxID=1176355 RepID=A0A4Q9M1N3_9MICR|nr:hypothetical protein CWI38_0042p0070 [Hamiltosporidium tvaerminnensis]
MSHCESDSEESPTKNTSENSKECIFNNEFKNILNNLFETYSIYIQAIIDLQSGNYHEPRYISKNELIEILISIAEFKLLCFKELHFLEPITMYELNFCVNLNCKNQCSSQDLQSIYNVFNERELMYTEMLFRFNKIAIEMNKCELCEFLNRTISENLEFQSVNVKKLKEAF